MYSIDFREACIRIYNTTHSFRKVAVLIGSSASSICRWYKNVYNIQCRKERASKASKPVILNAIDLYLCRHPFATCVELQQVLLQSLNVSISYELTRLAVHKAGYSRKRPRFYAAPQHLQSSTDTFIQQRDLLRGRHFVYIDETGFSSNVRPTMGYSKRGKRLHIRYQPSSQEKKHITTVALADSKTGEVTYTNMEGHCNTLRFVQFLHSLQLPPGVVFVMDNVSFHHSRDVKNIFTLRGWISLHTPPYSPWFNPIERIFALVKAAYRRHRNIELAFTELSPMTILNILSSRCLE